MKESTLGTLGTLASHPGHTGLCSPVGYWVTRLLQGRKEYLRAKVHSQFNRDDIKSNTEEKIPHTDSVILIMKSNCFDIILHFWALFVKKFGTFHDFSGIFWLFCFKKSFVTCHESHVICDMSHVTCHLPHVTNTNRHRPSSAGSPIVHIRLVPDP